jgi:ABC-type nitrate/sulfonate/bicarbonate transport system permease component
VSTRQIRGRLDILGVLGLVLLLVAWWTVSELALISQVKLPAPGDVSEAVTDNFWSSPYLNEYYLGDGGLASSLEYTVANVLIALAISIAIGVTLGLLSAQVGGVRAVFDPVVLALGTIPILVTAPFFLIWFGTSRAAQIALVAIYQTTILYLFAQRALENLNPVYAASAQTLGATPRRILRDVYLPGGLPEIFGGIRIALAGAWGLEAFSELLGAPNGIGRVVQALATASDIPTIMGAIAVLAIAAVVIDMLAVAVMAFVTRWRPQVPA